MEVGASILFQNHYEYDNFFGEQCFYNPSRDWHEIDLDCLTS